VNRLEDGTMFNWRERRARHRPSRGRQAGIGVRS
jgi:hypothetical protein